MGTSSSREKEWKSTSEAHVVSTGRSQSEKHVAGSNVPISFKTLMDGSKAVCKVVVHAAYTTSTSTATAFLAKFSSNKGDLVCGLFTNNHVLGNPELADNCVIDMVFDGIPVGDSRNSTSLCKRLHTNGLFRFTCSVLDATFIRFDQATIAHFQECSYLTIGHQNALIEKQPLIVFQHPKGMDVHFAQGSFIQYYGTDFFHSVSTDYGSSGSPIALCDGTVVGIHKARPRTNANHNIAVTMTAVIQALLPFYDGSIAIPSHLVSNPIELDHRYSCKISAIGLDRCFVEHNTLCELKYLKYVSPASKFLVTYITPIWFAATSHGWYWTPTDPLHSTLETNWMPVSQLRVIGGFWDGVKPADKNVVIIQWLLSNNIIRGVCPNIS